MKKISHPSIASDRSNRRVGKLSKLGGYVATTVGAGVLATPATDAAVIGIDIGPTGFNIAGVNAGVPADSVTSVVNFPFTGAGDISFFNGFADTFWGLSGEIATSDVLASPVNIPFGGTIDSSLYFGGGVLGMFRVLTFAAPDFGPGSYIGFQTAAPNPHYGYLEVTWDSTSNQFQILSGAYESDPNTPILAGASPSAVPEIDPSGLASVASMAMGALAILEQRRRKRAAAAA